MGRKLKTTQEWIKEAEKVHGNKYIYDDKCVYFGSNKKITVKCKKHGYFNVTANEFLRGVGCQKCAIENKQYTTDTFVKKAKEVHGNKYDYSKVNYTDSKTKVCIICPKHGEFWQVPTSHLNGNGCLECYHERVKNNKDYEQLTENFIKKAILIHGNKYDYSKTEYKTAKAKVCIVCPEHGEFYQTPCDHLQGKGCRLCGINSIKEKLISNKKEIIEKANLIHEQKYRYGEFNGMRKKMKITCPIHGDFYMTPMNHIYKKEGCPICGKEKNIANNTMTNDEFIKKCKEIHNNKYDYSITKYNGWNNDIQYICHQIDKFGNKHGVITQKASNHINLKNGCQKCAKNYVPTNKELVDNFKLAHGNIYDYSKVNYIDSSTEVCITCPKHGEFYQLPYVHLQGSGCPKCASNISKAENEISDFIRSLGFEVINNERTIIKPQELDIYIPERKIAIEYNGLRWHSEEFNKGKYYHLDKLIKCNNNGIKLIHIFEDEYNEHKDIVLEKIRHILDKDECKEKIYARKCFIKEINSNETKIFLNSNHIQGFVSSSVYIGAYYMDRLIAVMTFKKENNSVAKYELNRFATDINKHCIGIGGKLLKYFIGKYNPTEIKSFADRRWTLNAEDNLYIKLGFKLVKVLSPDYKYIGEDRKLHHKFGFRKQILIKKYPNEKLTNNLTESEMCDRLGFYKVWDCGLFKYVLKNYK